LLLLLLLLRSHSRRRVVAAQVAFASKRLKTSFSLDLLKG
jgi:hypothetical protein